MERTPVTDPLMTIGMFSRASLVSVKALRSYHEMGLLIPAEVHPDTNHRSYRVSQLPDATVIKRLRDLDLPLKDISEIVAARDPDTTRKILAEHEAIMRDRLDQTQRIVDELQHTIERPSLQTPIHIRTEPATHALVVRGVVQHADYAAFLDGAFADLFATLASSGAIPNGPTGARYPASVQTDNEPIEAILPIAAPVPVEHARVVLALIPETTCAVATHAGGYESIGDTYRQLGAWVAHHAVSAEQPVRELYVVSIDPLTLELLPPDERRTEICWPITPSSSETKPNKREP